jgi:hypothetical protein
MRTKSRVLPIIAGALFALFVFAGGNVTRLGAKEKIPAVSPDDPTLRLYNLLDSKFGGKLDTLYLLADTFTDPKNPQQVEQRVLRVEYNKNSAFGKFRIYVRTVDMPSPEQFKAYSPKEIYDFGETDSEKFTKTDPGSFGRPGDVYSQPTMPGGPLGTVPATEEVQARYDRYVTQYILPALEKKEGGGTGS